MSDVKILSVVSELYPLVKTGGLADVGGALPDALREQGIEMVTLLPGYPSVMAALGQASEVFAEDDCFGGAARVLAAFFFGHPPLDPLVFGGAAALFTIVALAACLGPSRRALGIDPVNVLRYE